MRDVLTQTEINTIMRSGGTIANKYDMAARLGAERERERAERVLALARECAERDDARDAERWRTVEKLAESRWDGTLGRPATWWLSVSGISGDSFGEVIDKVRATLQDSGAARNDHATD